MRVNNVKCRILSTILCASMVFQGVSMNVYAAEDEIIQEQTVQDDLTVETESEESPASAQTVQETSDEKEQPSVETPSETVESSEADVSTEVAVTEEEKETSSVEETTEEAPKTEASEETTVTETTEELTEEETTEGETTEEVTTEEETTEEETTTEELISDQAVEAAFSDIELFCQGYDLYYSGKFQGAEGVSYYPYFDIVQYDSTNKEIDRCGFYSSCEGTEYTFGTSAITLNNDTKQIKFYARGTKSDDYTTEVETYSEVYTLDRELPDVTFAVSNMKSGAESLYFDLSYEGDLHFAESDNYSYDIEFNYIVKYGTTEDKSQWKTEQGNVYYYNKNDSPVRTLNLRDLEANKTYYGEIEVYKESSGSNSTKVFSQTIPLTSFKTTENTEYDVAKEFPDENFRKCILNSLYLSEDTKKVTKAQLESINGISCNRSSYADPAINDITGIDLLTNLTSIYLKNHEISDISKIKWENLKKLKDVSLSGNDISVFPDLSECDKLTYVDLRQNCLDGNALSNLNAKLPSVCKSCYVDNQRTGDFSLLTEDTYYQNGSNLTFFVQMQNFKTDLGYTVKIYVDGTEYAMDGNSWNGIYYTKAAQLSTGTHKVKAELAGGEEVIATTSEVEFDVEKGADAFLQNGTVYVSPKSNYLSFNIYTVNSHQVSDAKLVDKKGNVLAEKDGNPSSYEAHTDPRYHKIKNAGGYTTNLYQMYVSMQTIRNILPAGTYDIVLNYADGTDVTIPDAVEVTEIPSVTNCFTSGGYDNMGEYLYLALSDNGVDPSKLEYMLSYEGSKLEVSYVNCKKTYSGHIVKLKINNRNNLQNYGYTLKLQAKSGYSVLLEDEEYNIYFDSGIYYTEYNPVTGYLEVGVTQDISLSAPVFTVYDSNDENKKICDAVIVKQSDGLIYLKTQKDGVDYTLPAGSNYMLKLVHSTGEASQGFYISGSSGSSNSNYWSKTSKILENSSDVYFYYFDGVAYEKDSKDQYTAEISGGTLTAPLVLDEKSIGTYSAYDGASTGINMKIPVDKLEKGNYTVTLSKNGTELSSTDFEIVANEKFYLQSTSAWWEDSNTIQIYLNTPNTAKTDDYQVVLTDPYGNQVSGLTSTVTNRYSNSLYIQVKGLKYADAYRNYYIKVTHKTFGDPVKNADTSYYSDEKGEYRQIYLSKYSYTTDHNRMIGFTLKDVTFPITLSIYKPYDTEKIYTTVVKENQTNNGWYYFTKELYDALPDQDALYDVEVVNGEGEGYLWDKKNIGYSGQTTKPEWTVDVTSLQLDISDESTKTAVITVSGNTNKPAFKSSNTSAVKVEVSKDNPNQAVVTAVGLGVADITITADNITRTIPIEVIKTYKVTGISMNRDILELTAKNEPNDSDKTNASDDSKYYQYDLYATVIPIDAWNDQQVIQYASSDETVVSFETRKDGSIRVSALKPGAATITATLVEPDGTKYTAECKITVKGRYTDKQIADKIEDVCENAMPYFLANKDKTLKDCELPEGWTWVDDTVKLTADNAAPIQYFTAVYEEKNYESFEASLPVAVTKITGISVTGDTVINLDNSSDYEINCLYTGYYDEKVKERLTVTCTKTGKTDLADVEAYSMDGITIKAKEGTKGGTQSFDVVVKIDNGTKSGTDLFKKTLSVTIPAESCVEELSVYPTEENINTDGELTYKHEEDSGLVKIDAEDVIANKRDKIVLNVDARTGDEWKETLAVKWATTDSSVASVKYDSKTKKHILTVKKQGSAVITATMNDKAKATASLVIAVKDYEPEMEVKSLILNKYSTEGVSFTIQEKNDNRVTSLKILEGDTESANFKAEMQTNGTAVLSLKEKAPAKDFTRKTTSKCTLEITTNNGKTYSKPLSIVTDVTKPTATLKVVSKANLFYTDAKAVYQLSSKYEIDRIEDLGSTSGYTATFDAATNQVTFDATGKLTKDTYKEYVAKKTTKQNTSIKVYFKNYTEPQTISMKVATVNTKPQLQVSDITLFKGVQVRTASITDKKTKAECELSADDNKVSVTKGDGVALSIADNGLQVTYTGTRALTYQFSLSDKAWTQDLSLSGKIKFIKEAKDQTLVLGTSKVILNTDTNISKNGEVPVEVSVKEDKDTFIEYIKFGNSALKLIEQDYLHVGFDPDGQMLYVGLNEGKRGKIKAGTYKLDVYGVTMVGEKEVTLKKATLNIQLTEKNAAKISLSAKGSINLVDRANTEILYTPKVSGMTADLAYAYTTGNYRDCFSAQFDQETGKIILKANEGMPMRNGMTYPVTIRCELDNGYEIDVPVKVKPANKYPKVKASVTRGTLYRTNSNTLTTVLSIDKTPDISQIEWVELDPSGKYNDYFTLSADTVSTDGNITLTLGDNKLSLKKGTYTIKYLVYFKDAAYNAKPVTMSIKVTVK